MEIRVKTTATYGPKIKAATQKLRKFLFGAFKALGKKRQKVLTQRLNYMR
jgi:hypothetical protein